MSHLLTRESFVMTDIVFRHWGKMFWFPLGSYFHDDNQIRFRRSHLVPWNALTTQNQQGNTASVLACVSRSLCLHKDNWIILAGYLDPTGEAKIQAAQRINMVRWRMIYLDF